MKARRFTTALLTFLTFTSCNLNYLDYLQHVESPDGKYYFGLYSDFGIGDQGFLILKLDKNINPKDLKINYSLKYGITAKDAEWIHQRTILYNYDEADEYCNDPKIEIFNRRFLVFSRGGFMFGLYDLKTAKDTFNIVSPWNEWFNQSDYKSKKNDKAKEEKEYGEWIKENLDQKIKNYIATNK